MYAECPNCHAIFRVTPAILEQANGNVRCGECQTVFKAMIESPDPEDVVETVDTGAVSGPETEIIDELTEEEMAELLSTDVEEEVATPEVITETENETEAPPGDTDESQLPETETEELQPELFGQHEAPEPELPVVEAAPTETEEAPTEAQATLPPEGAGNRSSIFENHSFLGITALVLLLLLGAQYLYKNRNELAQYPSMRPLLESLCGAASCDLPPQIALPKVELLNHGIYSHPNENDALMIKATIVNHAKFSQPLPIIELSLSNIRGEKIALRRFGPSEYLPSAEEVEGSLMETEKQISISLQVKDPGKDALAFEFEFL